jgi:hypothetical protein
MNMTAKIVITIIFPAKQGRWNLPVISLFHP